MPTSTSTTPSCHYDPALNTRVTNHHTPHCPTHTGGPCPARHHGCTPCPHPHCTNCGHRHLTQRDVDTTTGHHRTCPTCINTTRDDLHDIRWNCRHLRWHATRGGHNGHLLAASPIPGGDAMVLIGPHGGDGDQLIWNPHLDDDHHARDVVPPLLPLAIWDTRIRALHGHTPATRPTLTTITGYMAAHLTALAQNPRFDWPGFAADIAALRRMLEQVLHDETEPEQGVPCFDCGSHLVRRFGKAAPCRHDTPGRRHIAAVHAQAAAARDRLAVYATYPELGPATYADEKAARRRPTAAEESAARRPCAACVEAGQGGIADPTVGQSWECLGCRKQYTAGEYATAVRTHLLTRGQDGDGWTFPTMAADAASTQTGMVVPAATVRKWADRGRVASCCRLVILERGEGEVVLVQPSPQRLVYWPDVAEAAAEAVARQHELARERDRRAREASRFYALLDGGMRVVDAAERMALHPNRVRSLVAAWEAARRHDEANDATSTA
ncbi:hypothetical protein [Nocardioides bruguierae]|uniref:hypothetical protein n=1 Tax=Nocardioides bruguierae TaxID=2945102 RepID=UPI002020544F|nr:hypothetical protein [Nocardioides bruguierae]MCL8026328.1 hypothetical protein [Nocardioides bruguierae]